MIKTEIIKRKDISKQVIVFLSSFNGCIKCMYTDLLSIIIKLGYARVCVDVDIVWSDKFGMYSSALSVGFIRVFDNVNFNRKLKVQLMSC